MGLAVVLQQIIEAAKIYGDTPKEYDLAFLHLHPEPDEFCTLSLARRDDNYSYNLGGNYFTGTSRKITFLNPEEAAVIIEHHGLIAKHAHGAVKEKFKEAFSDYLAQACKNVIRKRLDERLA